MGTRFAKFSSRIKRFPQIFDIARTFSRFVGFRSNVYRLLKTFLSTKSKIRFLQIGANDGISTDPIREFVVFDKRWEGVLVEPQPSMFAKCKQNYSYCNNGRLRFLQAAVSDRSGQLELWKIADSHLSQFPLFATGMASTNRMHLTSYFSNVPEIDRKIEAFIVPCVTLHEIFARYHINDLELLHMDVEGHESTILHSLASGTVWPKVILFERVHLSTEVWHSLQQFLLSNGYEIHPADLDCFAIRR